MQDFQGNQLAVGDVVAVAGRSHSTTYLKKGTIEFENPDGTFAVLFNDRRWTVVKPALAVKL